MMPGENVMGQKQRTTYHMMSQGMRNQMVRDQDRMASGMYLMMDQRQTENTNQRMQEMRRGSGNAVDRRMMDSMAQRNQMQSRRMIKRDADPSFQYTVASGLSSSAAAAGFSFFFSGSFLAGCSFLGFSSFFLSPLPENSANFLASK